MYRHEPSLAWPGGQRHRDVHATERPISRPSMLRSSTHSDYKSLDQHAEVPCDRAQRRVHARNRTRVLRQDQRQRQLHNMAQRTPQACGDDRKPALIYDNGRNNIRSFAENGVLLLRPYVKEQRQVAASPEE